VLGEEVDNQNYSLVRLKNVTFVTLMSAVNENVKKIN